MKVYNIYTLYTVDADYHIRQCTYFIQYHDNMIIAYDSSTQLSIASYCTGDLNPSVIHYSAIAMMWTELTA